MTRPKNPPLSDGAAAVYAAVVGLAGGRKVAPEVVLAEHIGCAPAVDILAARAALDLTKDCPSQAIGCPFPDCREVDPPPGCPAATGPCPPIVPAARQVWADLDPRANGRRIRVLALEPDHAVVELVGAPGRPWTGRPPGDTRTARPGRRTRVRLDRFRQPFYRLAEHAPPTGGA